MSRSNLPQQVRGKPNDEKPYRAGWLRQLTVAMGGVKDKSKETGLTLAQRYVLLVLAQHVDWTCGITFVSAETLMQECAMGDEVRGYLHHLRELGLYEEISREEAAAALGVKVRHLPGRTVFRSLRHTVENLTALAGPSTRKQTGRLKVGLVFPPPDEDGFEDEDVSPDPVGDYVSPDPVGDEPPISSPRYRRGQHETVVPDTRGFYPPTPRGSSPRPSRGQSSESVIGDHFRDVGEKRNLPSEDFFIAATADGLATSDPAAAAAAGSGRGGAAVEVAPPVTSDPQPMGSTSCSPPVDPNHVKAVHFLREVIATCNVHDPVVLMMRLRDTSFGFRFTETTAYALVADALGGQ